MYPAIHTAIISFSIICMVHNVDSVYDFIVFKIFVMFVFHLDDQGTTQTCLKGIVTHE